MLNEASWDDQNVFNGKRYSQFIREVFDGRKPLVPDEESPTSGSSSVGGDGNGNPDNTNGGTSTNVGGNGGGGGGGSNSIGGTPNIHVKNVIRPGGDPRLSFGSSSRKFPLKNPWRRRDENIGIIIVFNFHYVPAGTQDLHQLNIVLTLSDVSVDVDSNNVVPAGVLHFNVLV